MNMTQSRLRGKMPINKNVLFITHHNNDLDHFLPLAVHLKIYEKMHIKMIAFYTEHELLKNKLHKYICDSNEINFDSMIDVMNFRFLNKAIFMIYKHVIMNRRLSNPMPRIRRHTPNGSVSNVNIFKNALFETVSFFKYPKKSILKLLDFVLIRYVVFCSIFFVTKEKMISYISSNKIDLVIIDQRVIDKSLIDSNVTTRFLNVYSGKVDPMDLVLFRFLKASREKNIPIFMMPHGPQPISKPNVGARYKERSEKIKDSFRPDFLALCNKNECSSLHHMLGIQSTLIIGDPRYDEEWIDYLESCALKVYRYLVKKTKGKIVLLYIMDIFLYDLKNNEEFKANMHRDILSMVNHFQNLEVWVKHHPRNVFEISVDNYIQEDRRKYIRQFGNDVDTNILLAKADICLSASSTTLISPIVQRKPVVFYNKWKEVLDATSIYDELRFTASSKDELIVQCEKIINGYYSIDDDYIESFYKNVFSFDDFDKTMVEKYSGSIKGMMNINKVISVNVNDTT